MKNSSFVNFVKKVRSQNVLDFLLQRVFVFKCHILNDSDFSLQSSWATSTSTAIASFGHQFRLIFVDSIWIFPNSVLGT